jgi:hypothetical protein
MNQCNRPHFQRLVRQVAKTLRDAGNVSAGLQACTVDRLNERLGWLCVHARYGRTCPFVT